MFLELVRLGEKANTVLEMRLASAVERALGTEPSSSEKVDFNLTKAVILLAIYKPQNLDPTPSTIGRQTSLSRSRVSHQVQDMLRYRWIQYSPGCAKRVKLELSDSGYFLAKVIQREVNYFETQLRKGFAKELDLFQRHTFRYLDDRLSDLEVATRLKMARTKKVLTPAATLQNLSNAFVNSHPLSQGPVIHRTPIAHSSGAGQCDRCSRSWLDEHKKMPPKPVPSCRPDSVGNALT